MLKQQLLHRLINPGVIAIIRTGNSHQLLDATKALCDGGITAIEVTMCTPNALQIVEDVASKLGDTVLMGVGSVMDGMTARMAILAGAHFVTTTIVKPAVINVCNDSKIPVICGAFTPTEAQQADEEGADFVKIFPAENMGPGYIRTLKVAMPHLQLIPTGGITAANCGEWIKAGSTAVGIGTSLTSEEILLKNDWKTLSQQAALFVKNTQKARTA